MAKLHMCILLAVASSLAAAAMLRASGYAYGAECKRKTAGFYLEDTKAAGAQRLAVALQNLPVSLTGAAGDSARGRDVLVNRQKGDCLSCHQVSGVAPAEGQGAIGPALDGAGKKYSEGQLRQILLEPKSLFPDTMMPAYYRGAGAAGSVLTAAEIEDLVAFLATLK
jgi:sulfur-oxidizing protein SoxX